MENREITILGSPWAIIFKDNDPAFEMAAGYCCDVSREIIIENIKAQKDSLGLSPKQQELNQKSVIRHEIVHAYLSECGLADSSNQAENWAINEEMVDWFARMGPKIHQTWKEAGAL